MKSDILEELFVRKNTLSLPYQIANPSVLAEGSLDIVVEVLLLVCLLEGWRLFYIEYFLMCGKGLASILLNGLIGILQEEHTGEGVFSIILFAYGVHDSLVFLTLLCATSVT